MDIKEYIASGVLESYVLGTASKQERQEVECISSIYPEIKEELVTLQKNIEAVASANKIEPPKELKNIVLSAVYDEIDNDLEEKSKVINHDFSGKTEAISIQKNTWKMTAVASFVLFIIATSVFINSRVSNIRLSDEIENKKEEVKIQKDQLAKTKNRLKEELNQKENYLAFLSDSETKQIQLDGTENSKGSKVRVYWNPLTERVVLKVDELPEPPTKMQYQLWAIVDGTPQDMGMLPKENIATFIDMTKKTGTAAAFAITLEEEGGKPTPNLEQLYVIGNV
ncbi:MAG: anti-sigma factor [Brumimicrobium sp.]